VSAMDVGRFRFQSQVRVRNYEIDWQGIVHNANYLLYFETGRVGYLEHLGIPVDIRAIQNESKVVVVRNEIDYRAPAHFGEVLEIFTRVAFIRSSSFAFEGILQEAATGRRIAENVCIHVWLDPRDDRPVPVPHVFRRKVREFEGEFVLLQEAGESI
jgi:acyl-CoA thioester hydrolase